MSVSEELSSVETAKTKRRSNGLCRVSEELSSVETKIRWFMNLRYHLFQKNLVVWKLRFATRDVFREDMFQKNLVVWKQSELHSWVDNIAEFQKNLVVWKRMDRCFCREV